MKPRDLERERLQAIARRGAAREENVRIERNRRLRVLDDPGARPPHHDEPTAIAPAAGFCAICTAPTPAGAAMQPLGRDRSLVIVCTECDDVHPRSGRYSFADSTAKPVATTRGSDGNRRTSRKAT